MRYIFLVLLCGLPWAYLIFNKTDVWHAQGHYFQLGILVLLAYSFFEKSRQIKIRNIPLGIFTLWAGLVTAFYWYVTLANTGKYAILIFLPFFNFLCFLLFYKFSIEYLKEKDIERILKGLAISVSIVLGYCILQKLHLDQFYTPLGSGGSNARDSLVGTIGNSTHLAGYLAICQPLFFRRGWYNYLALIVLWIIIALTGSASGVIVGVGVVLFYLVFKKKYYQTCIIVGICGLLLFIFRQQLTGFFSFNHRLEFWQALFEKFKQQPITGQGLGILNAWKIKPLTSTWRHAHLEYYQLAVELGVIGLGILLWGIFDYFKRFWKFRTDLTIRLASIFLGIVLLGLFSFPIHLWLLSSMAMLSYSWLYVLKGEKQNEPEYI